MGDKRNSRKSRKTKKQHLKELKKKHTATLLPSHDAPPPPPPPPPHTIPPPVATSTLHFSPPSTSPSTSASARKLDFSAEMEQSGVDNGSEFMLVEKNSFLQWVNSFARCECGEMMNVKMKSECGMVKTYQAECELCSEKSTWCTSPGGGTGRYEVHRRAVVAGLHCGDGFVAVQKLCMALNMPMIHHKTFSKYQKDIQDSSIKKFEELLEQTRKKVHRVLEEKTAAEVEGLSEVAAKVAKEKDNVRVKNAKRKVECKEERKRKKIKAIQEEESRGDNL